MSTLLFLLHMVGLTGLGGGVAALLVSRIVQSSKPEDAKAIRPILPRLGHITRGGLGLLWLTGIPLVFVEFGGLANLPTWFWVKIVDVIILTALVIYVFMLQRRMAETGDRSLAARAAAIQPFTLGLAYLAVVFAVLAFH
jgi:hypothetical protein